MNVPQLRFDGFDGKWERMSFKDIFFEKTERTNDMNQYPLFSLTVEKGVTPKTNRYERSFLVKEGNDNYKIVNPDDFVYNPMNLTLGAVAKHKKNINISVSGYYNVFSANPEFNSNFLEMYIKSYKMILHYKAIATGSLIEKQRVHFSQFVKIKRPIPSLKEQNKIGDFFAKLDQRIAKQQEKVEKLVQFKKGVMQKIFSQELRFKDEDGREFGEWEEKKLIDISLPIKRTLNEINYQMPVLSISAGKGFLNQTDRFSQVIAGESLGKYTLLRKGELSYNRGASKAFPFGCIYSLQSYNEALVPNVYRSFQLLEGYETSFYEQLFSTGYANRQLRQFVSSSARLDGLLNINQDDFFTLKFPVPSRIEQKIIGDFLTELDHKTNKEKEKLMVLEEQKKGFTQRMFV